MCVSECLKLRKPLLEVCKWFGGEFSSDCGHIDLILSALRKINENEFIFN
jgi:hypothetical protein